MEQYHRIECGKILRNKVGQLFFACQTCYYEFHSLDLLMQHQTSAHGVDQMPDLQQSPEIFPKETNQSFEETQNVDISPSSSSSHVCSAHVSQTNDEIILPGKYRCSKCLLKFNSLDALDSHNEKCPSKSRIKCDYCSRTFSTVKGSRLHMHSHHESKLPFVCTVCPKSFNHRYELTLHRQKHAKNQLVACYICGENFLSEYERERHIKHRHPFATYQCKDCVYETKYEGVLRRHQVTKH